MLSRNEAIALAVEIVSLLIEFDRFTELGEQFIKMRLRLSANISMLYTLAKIAGVRDQVLTEIRKNFPDKYLQAVMLQGPLDSIHEDNLKRDAEPDIKEISQSTIDVISKISKPH